MRISDWSSDVCSSDLSSTRWADRGRRASERRLEQHEHPAPGLFGGFLIIGAPVGRAPAVERALVDLDLVPFEARVEPGLEPGLFFRVLLVVIVGDREEIAGLGSEERSVGTGGGSSSSYWWSR